MRKQPWMVWLGAVVLVLVTARLGLWQMDRAQQKLAVQQAMSERASLPPLAAEELAQDDPVAQQQWYRRITLRGYWIPSATIALENRTMGGQTGFLVLTPLRLPDGTLLLVQRGWLPRDPADRTRLQLPPLPEGPVEISGRVAPAPSRLLELGEAASGALRQNVDLPSLAREWRGTLRPLSLQESRASADDGLRRDWTLPAADVGKHHGYAFQWFGLSALTLGLSLWFLLLRPRLRRAAPEERASP